MTLEELEAAMLKHRMVIEVDGHMDKPDMYFRAKSCGDGVYKNTWSETGRFAEDPTLIGAVSNLLVQEQSAEEDLLTKGLKEEVEVQ